jgi:hypothetical protein
MPYITKEQRPPFDELIGEILVWVNGPLCTDDAIAILAIKFKEEIVYHKPEIQDGEFNYFLTKLMIKLNWIDGMTYYSYLETSKKINKLVCECLTIYSTPKPSYYNYNRAIGMLYCCQLEFKRRYGNSRAALPIMFLQMIIKKLYECEIGLYEDLKISLNGDVI